jgi:hypothetical protein
MAASKPRKRRRPMSYWAEGALNRRDFRQDHGGGPETPGRLPAKKDTKRWCRGKAGRDHNYKWQPVRWSGSLMVEVCAHCSRRRNYGYGRS